MNTRFLMLTLLLCASVSFADQVIELNDGSRLYGEVLSMKDNQYRIKTGALGVVTLDAGKIASIRGQEESVSARPNPTANSAIQTLQSTITSNPGLMSKILSLQNDPDMQAALADPEVVRAVQTLDMETLANNPRIKALMNNPTVKAIQSGAGH